jgi:predicted nucleotidyltransferase component of viral defense system
MKIDLLDKSQLSIINKQNFRYPLAKAEKDYFLAIVLKILYNSPLKDKLIFKGGTAVNHLYLDQLRFSEDLDFGTLKPVNLEDLKKVFSEYDFLEIKKVSITNFTLKIEKLKFVGPLGHPNSLKINIDLVQEIIRPPCKINYNNVYGVDVKVLGMDLVEICTEKVRAMNERARYRDFYDITMVFKKKPIEPSEIINILKKKELKRELKKEHILENLKIAQEAKDSGAENLYYREEVTKEEIENTLNKLFPFI